MLFIYIMLYLKCPSCHELLGNKEVQFVEKLNDIIASNDDEEQKNQKKMNLVNNMHFKRICCKMRLMTYKMLINIVK